MKKMTRDEYKEILLGNLEYIDNICRKKNINYTVIGGSLIGAIRHNGMIPWDDDIDIALLRDDYDKLVKAIEDDNNQSYVVNTWKNNDTYYYPYAKLINTSTFIKEKNLKEINNYGLFVDIFPIDNVPNNFQRFFYFRKKIYRKLICGLTSDKVKNEKFSFLKNIRIFVAKKIIGRDKILANYEKLCEKFNNTTCSLGMTPWFTYGRQNETWELKLFSKYIDKPFENLKVKVISDYDFLLKKVYGDYMILPPPEKRVTHGIDAYWRDDCYGEKK